VRDITNTADETYGTRSVCGNGNVDAYGVAVIAAGSKTSAALQHVVVEGNTVTGTRTGQSETVTFNGDLTDFLAAHNVIDDVDNIGLDTIGWETGSSRANHGYIEGNTVYNVDIWSNAAYGQWRDDKCVPQPENAAGLYDDGGSYIWFASNSNRIWNTDQGINLDVETRNAETDHLLVSGNIVHDDPGTSAGDPSDGTNPPATAGTSTVAGHDAYALYIDAFGSGATIEDVYVHDNVFQNESQHFLVPSDGMPSVDLGGRWSIVERYGTTQSKQWVRRTSTTRFSSSTRSRSAGPTSSIAMTTPTSRAPPTPSTATSRCPQTTGSRFPTGSRTTVTAGTRRAPWRPSRRDVRPSRTADRARPPQTPSGRPGCEASPMVSVDARDLGIRRCTGAFSLWHAIARNRVAGSVDRLDTHDDKKAILALSRRKAIWPAKIGAKTIGKPR
jgi:hypothetical protein